MSELPIQQGGLRVLSSIVPSSSASTYGTHYSYLGVGGYVEVPNIEYRNSIPSDSNMNDEGYSTGRRRYGMLVYVIDDDKLFRLFPYSGSGIVSLETFTATTELAQVTMLSNNNGWVEVPDLSVLITGGTYFSGSSSIVLYDSTGGTVSITGITTTDVVNPGDGRVLVSTGNSESIFVAQPNMVFNGTNLNITGGTFITDSGGSLHSSAIIQFKSTTKGVLLPGMTTSQKNAIVNPTTGLTVYDSTIEDISVYTSSGWTGVIAERDDLQKVTERGNTTNRGLIISGTTYIIGSGSTTGNTFVTSNSANTQTFTIKDNGNVLIGTTTDAGYKLDVNGNTRSNRFYATDGITLQRISFEGFNNQTGIDYNSTSGLFKFFASGSNFISAGFNLDTIISPVRNTVNNIGDVVIQGGGSERVRFKANGNVLINTTTDAGYKLDVNGSTRIVGSGSTTGNTFVTSNSANTQTFTIKDNGNVLIGTTTDGGYKLDVNGTTRLNGNVNLLSNASLQVAGQTPNIQFGTTGLFNGNWVTQNGKFRINSSGYNIPTYPFSIGNSSQTASGGISKIAEISGTLVAAANNDVLVSVDISPTFTNGSFTGVENIPLRVINGAFTGVNSSFISLTRTDGSTAVIGNRGSGWNEFGIWGGGRFGINTSPDLAFSTAGQIVSRVRFVVEGSNNLLVGTSTDSGYKLDVNGTVRFQDNLLFSSTKGIYATSTLSTILQSSTNYFTHNRVASSGTLGFQIAQVGNVQSFWRWNDGTGDVEFGNAGGYGLQLYTNNLSRVIILSNGNVLIGTTTNAGYKLDVSGTTRVNDTFSITNGGSNERFIQVRRGSGWLCFGNTAGSEAIAMNNGTLLIGVTPDSQTAKVQIQGTGSTSLTKPFLIQNSTGTQLGYVDDSGQWVLGTGSPGTPNSGFYPLSINGLNGLYISTTNNSAYNAIVVNNDFLINGVGTVQLGRSTAGTTFNASTHQFNISSSSNRITTTSGGGYSQGFTFAGSFGSSRTLSIGSGLGYQGLFYDTNSAFGIYRGSFETVSDPIIIASATGNALIGTSTDLGFKFVVSGSTLLRSSGSTSGSTILTLQNSLSATTTQFRSDGVFGISSASTFTTQVTSVISASTTNSGIAIVPNGTGAFTLSIPDGTDTGGGNARGQYAVDLKLGGRTAATQVASGNYSAVIGGDVSTASGVKSLAGGSAFATGTNSVALGGSSTASGSGSVAIGGEQGGGLGATASGRAAIAFGLANTATADFSNSLGGLSNSASGSYSSVVGGQSNTSSASNSSILGGWLNINTGGSYGSIGGGRSNVLSTSSWYTFIGGGWNNGIINGDYSVIVGGFSNSATTQYAAVIGGSINRSSGLYSLTHGLGNTASSSGSTAIGYYNIASGGYSFIFGSGNTSNSNHTSILGGVNNNIYAQSATIAGGNGNSTGSYLSFIGGGNGNYIANNSNTGYGYSSIVGGASNKIGDDDFPYRGSFIGGGLQNKINATRSFIGSGYLNRILTSLSSFIGGGESNTVNTDYSVIVGGQSNTISTNTYATVVGGLSNTASGAYSIAGGHTSVASGDWSTAFGDSNATGTGSFAAGTNATASGSRSISIGQSTTASGSNSIALGLYAVAASTGSFSVGEETYSESVYGVAFGYQSHTRLRAQQALSSGNFGSEGSAQQSLLTSRAVSATTSGSTITLSLDGTGVTNLITPYGNNRAWNVVVNTITVCTVVSGGTLTVGDAHSGEYKFLFKRVGGTSTISPITTSSEVADTSMGTASYTFSAGTSQQLAIVFNAPTTANNSTFRAVAKVALTEVAW